MKRLIKAAVVTAAIAAATLTPSWASATDLPGGAASATAAESTTKTFRCGSDRDLCQRKHDELAVNNNVGPIQFKPPAAAGLRCKGTCRGNYFYFNYTPK